MNSLVEKIKGVKGLRRGKPCPTSEIRKAQEALGVDFPEEFIDYVKAFGCIDFGNVEWTGLNIKGYLNTVTATEQEKSVNPYFPSGCFVLQDLGIDAKLVIVNSKGEVSLLQYDRVTPICDSISEYLDLCIRLQENG